MLCVELEAVNEAGARSWYQACAIDAQGNETGSAMARLVSLPVALAVESVIQGEISAGVSTAPAGRPLIDRWFASLAEQGDSVHWS